MNELKRYCSQFNTYAPSDDGNWVKASDAEAALAEKDARIKELEGRLELAYVGIKEMERCHEYCDCSDDPQDDICIGCNLRAILKDMEARDE